MRSALLALLLVACVHPSPNPRPTTDATCAQMCDHLDALGCPEAAGDIGPDGVPGTGDDATCERSCADLMADYPLPLDCMVVAVSCSAANACEVR